MRGRLGVVAVVAVVGAILSCCHSPSQPSEIGPRDAVYEPRAIRVLHGALGCLFEFRFYQLDPAEADRLGRLAAAEVDRIERVTSVWDPQSEISACNARADAGAPIPVSEELYAILKQCRVLSNLSDGAFDPTVGPLVAAYGLRTQIPSIPTAAERARLQGAIGIQFLEFNDRDTTIHFTKPGMALDLDGINKGIAVDRCVALLQKNGVTDAVITAGGSTVYSIGPPAEQPARKIAVEDPAGEARASVELRDSALSTSGNWRRTLEFEGKVYGHVFDPRTGSPVETDLVSVTVVLPGAADSDAFATAALVEGASILPRLETYDRRGRCIFVKERPMEPPQGGSKR